MDFTLPPHIWIALFAESVIVLDLHADRYSRLGGLASEAFFALASNRQLSAKQMDVALTLAMAGILISNDLGRRVAGSPLPLPKASALELVATGTDRQPGIILCGLAVIGAKARLKINGFERSIEAARTWKAAARSVAADDRAVALSRGFARRRNAVPIARACLPDSLALFRLLMNARVDATLVIGVRDQPFAAHCWVQTEAFVLSDALAPIRELTPIFSI